MQVQPGFVTNTCHDYNHIAKCNRAHIDLLHAESDEDLCLRLRADDQSALTEIMGRHRGMVMRLAVNVLSDASEAEDVVQEVFLIVWRSRAQWSEQGAKFSTWLHRVAINKAIDKRRARRAMPHSTEQITSMSDALVMLKTETGQAEYLEKQDIAKSLAREIARLPENQGVALRHSYIDDHDAATIARLMGISEQAVRSLLKRGKQALRKRLTNQGRASIHDAFAFRDAHRTVRGDPR